MWPDEAMAATTRQRIWVHKLTLSTYCTYVSRAVRMSAILDALGATPERQLSNMSTLMSSSSRTTQSPTPALKAGLSSPSCWKMPRSMVASFDAVYACATTRRTMVMRRKRRTGPWTEEAEEEEEEEEEEDRVLRRSVTLRSRGLSPDPYRLQIHQEFVILDGAQLGVCSSSII
jgi:hypothetical protein